MSLRCEAIYASVYVEEWLISVNGVDSFSAIFWMGNAMTGAVNECPLSLKGRRLS